MAIAVPGKAKHQIIHVDYMCNECGNCRSFCPYDSAPYLDKFTLFANEADFADSKNQGFVVLDQENLEFKVRYVGNEYVVKAEDAHSAVPQDLRDLMAAVCKEYDYLLK